MATDKSIPVCFHFTDGSVGGFGRHSLLVRKKLVGLKLAGLLTRLAGVAGEAALTANNELAKLKIESRLTAADGLVVGCVVSRKIECGKGIRGHARHRSDLVELVGKVDLTDVLADIEMVPGRPGIDAHVPAAPIAWVGWDHVLKNIARRTSVRRGGEQNRAEKCNRSNYGKAYRWFHPCT